MMYKKNVEPKLLWSESYLCMAWPANGNLQVMVSELLVETKQNEDLQIEDLFSD